MIVSQRLGVSHLWIDSLCIIQDSVEDWARECTFMGDIYRGSVMTITATEASDGTEGCFVDLEDEGKTCSIPYCEWKGNEGRQFGIFQASLGDQLLVAFDQDEVVKHQIDAQADPVPLTGGQLMEATVETVASLKERLLDLPFVSMPESRPNIEQGSVFQRGWIVQEQLLSTRMLYFTSGGMYWQCQECQRSEEIDSVLPQAEPFKFETIRKYLACDHKAKRTGIPCTNVDHTAISTHYIWLTLVNMFMSKHISYEADRLPALSSLARRFASLLDDSYVAGLWTKTFVQDLSWSCVNPRLDTTEYFLSNDFRSKLEEADPYTAPSWSWASARVPVDTATISASFGRSVGPELKIRCEVKEFRSEVQTLDNFGRLKNCTVRLLGLVKPVTLGLTVQEIFPHIVAWTRDPVEDRTLGGDYFDDLRGRQFIDTAKSCVFHVLLLGSQYAPRQVGMRTSSNRAYEKPIVSSWEDMGMMVGLIMTTERAGDRSVFKRAGVTMWGVNVDSTSQGPSPRLDWGWESIELV